MANARFVSDLCSVEEFFSEQENPNTLKNKTQRDVRLLLSFLQMKDDERNIEDIPVDELTEYICQFIISGRTKDRNEYKPTSLQSLAPSFEGHLKKKTYSVSIMNDLVFEKTRNILQSKQRQLKKQGKSEKPNASVALTSDKLKGFTRYTCSPDALLNTLWLNNGLHFGFRGCSKS